MKVCLISAFLALFIGSLVASAEDQHETQSTPVFPAQRFPSGYKGDDHSAVFSILKRMDISKKKEFESTNEYQARVDLAMQSGKIDFNRDFNFVIPNDVLSGKFKSDKRIIYNADRQQMTIKLDPKPMHDDRGDYSFYTYKLSEKITKLKNYVGSNAFGKKVVIERSHEYWRCVAFERDFLMSQSILVDIKSKFSQKQKESVAVSIIGKVVEPFIREERTYHSPTIDSPYDVTYDQACVMIKPSELVVFDTTTGQIYRRLGKDEIEASFCASNCPFD